MLVMHIKFLKYKGKLPGSLSLIPSKLQYNIYRIENVDHEVKHSSSVKRFKDSSSAFQSNKHIT